MLQQKDKKNEKKKSEVRLYARDKEPGHPKTLYEKLLYKALKRASRGRLDIITPNGSHFVFGDRESKQKATLHVHDYAFFKKCVLFGTTGFGEAYVENSWDSEDLYAVLDWFMQNTDSTPGFAESAARFVWVNILGVSNYLWHLTRKNTPKKAKENIAFHYDLSNDFYRLMLDSTMTYSSALYLTGNETLQEAQINKYEAISRKLNLQEQDHVLEIGSGWGGFATYAAEKYGCSVTTITISKEQFAFTSNLIKQKNLGSKVQIERKDYREVQGQYDKIVSIEMIEAIGLEYYDDFCKILSRSLKPDGIAVIQCITYPDSRFKPYTRRTDWIQKHIFPGSLLISLHEFRKSLLRVGKLEVYDVESMAISYARTLREWRHNFMANLDEVKAMGFSEAFIRKWFFYLVFCEVGFASRYINDVQIVLSRPENRKLEDFHGIAHA